jgi:polyhydroxyalkanoate synthase subunit PhaC
MRAAAPVPEAAPPAAGKLLEPVELHPESEPTQEAAAAQQPEGSPVDASSAHPAEAGLAKTVDGRRPQAAAAAQAEAAPDGAPSPSPSPQAAAQEPQPEPGETQHAAEPSVKAALAALIAAPQSQATAAVQPDAAPDSARSPCPLPPSAPQEPQPKPGETEHAAEPSIEAPPAEPTVGLHAIADTQPDATPESAQSHAIAAAADAAPDRDSARLPPPLETVASQVREEHPPLEATPTKEETTAAARPDAALQQPAPAEPYPASINVEALTVNVARIMEGGGRALAAYFMPREGASPTGFAEEVTEAIKTLGQVAQYWYADPQRSVEAQARLGKSFLELFSSMSQRLAGGPAQPAASPDPRDKRFSDPEWSSNHYFNFIKQSYLIVADWAKYLVDHADMLDPAVRHRADFYMRQIVNAAAPSNFLFTNPVLLRTTLSKSAENLAHGAKMLAEDIEAGGGELKIRQSDMSLFEVGRNLGITPGKVIYQNDLMQLIQYAPATGRVLKRPLLIVPPWINKFYVLDLTPDKSFIKWCVDQGLTVFLISWINPDERLASKDFGNYMREGPLQALDVIHGITGEDKVAAAGYCVGGTLLAFTLAYMAATRDDRITSATFLTTQVDFTHAGDLKIFASTEAQVAAVEQHMARRGYLEGSKMAAAFNLLRSNELIWPYVINNYMKGEAPFAFDLLYWNADSTRMPSANHSYYLRNCYLENNLVKGTLQVDRVTLDLRRVTIPVYNLATREDHIAPAKSVYLGSSFFGGPMRYVLSGSGHIAGVVNPPAKNKYQYWTGDTPHGDDFDAWFRAATMHPGSWWPDWMAWLKAQDGEEVAAREPGGSGYAPAEDAPGSYVKVRS